MRNQKKKKKAMKEKEKEEEGGETTAGVGDMLEPTDRKEVVCWYLYDW